MNQPVVRRPPIHYAWIVAAVTFFIMLISAGIRATPGVLMIPLTHAFGWTRETVSVALAINLALYGMIGPFSAALMERFGIRRVVMAALTCLAFGVGLTTFMQAPWQLDLLWGVVVGSGTGFTATILGAMVARRWFFQQRGLIIGVLSASNASGQLIFLPLLAKIVSSTSWHWACVITSVAALCLVPIVALFFRDHPRDKGLLAFGATAEDEPAALPPANPFRAIFVALMQAGRQRNFWLLAGSFFICGLSTSGLISNHLIPALMDHGFSEVRAAGLVASLGIFDMIGTTTSGWLSDRWDNRWLLCWYYGLRGLALLVLPFVLGRSMPGLIIFIVFYGLDWIATVPPTVRLANESFGAQSSIVYGWIWASHQLGSAIAAFGAGALYTWLKSYNVAFWSAGLLCLVASGMVLLIQHSASLGNVGRLAKPRPQVAAVTSE